MWKGVIDMAEKLCELKKKGGGGKQKETVLWTNNAPTRNQGAVSISLNGDLSDYDYIKFIYRYNTTNSKSFNLTIPYSEFIKCVYSNADNAFAIGASAGSNNYYYRYIWYTNDTTVATSHCFKYNSTTQSDSVAILTDVVGCKFR